MRKTHVGQSGEGQVKRGGEKLSSLVLYKSSNIGIYIYYYYDSKK